MLFRFGVWLAIVKTCLILTEFRRAFKFGYIKLVVPVQELLETCDKVLWQKVIHNPVNPLHDLLPPQERKNAKATWSSIYIAPG